MHLFPFLLRYLSTPAPPIMTGRFNHNQLVWKIYRNMWDAHHVEVLPTRPPTAELQSAGDKVKEEQEKNKNPCPIRHILSSMIPGMGKKSNRDTSKGTRSPFKGALWRTRARGMVPSKFR